MFGWKGDSLQRAMDSPCYVNCPTLKSQSISTGNKCTVPTVVDEPISGCKWSSPLADLLKIIAADSEPQGSRRFQGIGVRKSRSREEVMI